MKYMLANLGVNLVALGCIAAAAYLAIHDKAGWGWFLFVGLLSRVSDLRKGQGLRMPNS